MNVQEAIRVCRAQGQRQGYLFARPVSWQGSGEAIDLARRLLTTEALKVGCLGSPGSLSGSTWKPNPEDFLGDWETVTPQQLKSEKP